MTILAKKLTSLEKLFSHASNPMLLPDPVVSGFQNETLSWQVAFKAPELTHSQIVTVQVESPLKENITLRQVKTVPVRLAAYKDADEGYLSHEPGLYPDLLSGISNVQLRLLPDTWLVLWVSLESDDHLPEGTWPVEVRLTDTDNSPLASLKQEVRILPGILPRQKLIHTKWFHVDGLCQYYHQEPFSEENWLTVRRFIRAAVRRGINTILMPAHTPPLDTKVGGERLTTQLVEIERTGDGYRFDMKNVRRWIGICKEEGVEWFEMPHLYTQWGAEHAPKIIADCEGKTRRIFGWDTDACGPEYRSFLAEYIPALRAVLREEGVESNSIWHISDEPGEAHLEQYRKVKEQTLPLLQNCRIMDALSSFDFYRQGVVTTPIVSINHIEPFLEAGADPLWGYYCCGQYKDVSNVFIAMPSARTRMLAAPLFKYRIEGFLQWGYNFYNSMHSVYPIDPYATTDADGWVPAGDPFQVYPGPGGEPYESIRMAVFHEAMQDLRAMQWLESLTSHEYALHAVEEAAGMPITFSQYPMDAESCLRIRNAVNREILLALNT